MGGNTVYDAAGKPLKRDVVVEEPVIQPSTLTIIFQIIRAYIKGSDSLFGELFLKARLYLDFFSEPVEEKIQGHNLHLLQHQALFMKKNLYLIRNWITFLFRV